MNARLDPPRPVAVISSGKYRPYRLARQRVLPPAPQRVLIQQPRRIPHGGVGEGSQRVRFDAAAGVQASQPRIPAP
jgi:hypothetical protein